MDGRAVLIHALLAAALAAAAGAELHNEVLHEAGGRPGTAPLPRGPEKDGGAASGDELGELPR
ncbi:HBEGF factor, partial [Ceuthmochares aereus]|nr:HBEGF factor [Ceuthmochares aereus]